MSEDGRSPATSAWWLSAACCALLVALPFVCVTTPPITDLPQQSAQIRLLLETVGNDQSPYRIQWFDPNKLGYLPLAAGWLLAPPLRAGGAGMVLIGWAWVVAIHGLTRAAGRPLANAPVASLFFFNHVTYWGFVSFLTGLPAFILWLVLLRRPAAGWRRGTAIAGGAFLLYAAHVLWLAAGTAWLLLDAVLARRPWREAAVRSAWTAPALLAVAFWYPRFAASGFDSATVYGHPPWQRLHPDWLVGTALGGLRGPVPGLVLLAVAGWLALALWQGRERLASTIERPLLAAGLGFLLAALLLPGVRQHTIFFASRWLPVAAVFLVLALPAPRLRPVLRRTLPLLVLGALSLATANAWRDFERDELAGFHRALEALPAAPRLLGLDFVRQSPRIRDYPYYHLYAYGQVLRGGTLNRSFADQASSLVVFRQLPKTYPWTRDLDWRAHTVRRSDVAYFDHLLIFGDEAIHARFAADPRLDAVTTGAPWRLYRVHRALP